MRRRRSVRARDEHLLRRGWYGAGAIVGIASAILAYDARGLTFNADDWQYVLDGRPLRAHVLLEPHLQHLSTLPILAYRALRAVFGIASYWPYIVLLLVLHAAACLLLYAVSRRYIGSLAALAPTAVLALLGPAWHDLLWAFQIAYIAPVAAGLVMLLAMHRHDTGGDVIAAIGLLASVFSGSDGLGMIVLAAVLIASERPPAWRRLWIPGLATTAYLAWYAAYGVSDIDAHNVGRIWTYVPEALAAAFASVTGVGVAHGSPYTVATTGGAMVALAALTTLIISLRGGHRTAPLTVAAAAAALALWVAAALAYVPSREADQSRYQYYSAVFLLLAIVAGAPGWRPGRRSAAVLAAAALAIVASNLVILEHRAAFWRLNSDYTAAETGALDVARDVESPSYVPLNLIVAGLTRHNGILSIVAGPYLAAVARFGSPGDPPAAILARPEAAREAADMVLQNAERVALMPASGPLGRCVTAATGAALPEFSLGPGTVTVRIARGTVATLTLRRFADRYRRRLAWFRSGLAARRFPRGAQAPSGDLPEDRGLRPLWPRGPRLHLGAHRQGGRAAFGRRSVGPPPGPNPAGRDRTRG